MERVGAGGGGRHGPPRTPVAQGLRAMRGVGEPAPLPPRAGPSEMPAAKKVGGQGGGQSPGEGALGRKAVKTRGSEVVLLPALLSLLVISFYFLGP